jgi:nucleotidyltransferase substrate binding protein (TIGR01987 family)
LQERVSELVKATSRLEEACQQPVSSFIRDSVIRRFEFCWELAWKALRLRLEIFGVEVLNPRDTYQEALNKGLIAEGNLWSEAQKSRNLTSHTYDEALAEQVYRFVLDKGLPLFRKLSSDAQSWEN